jgi:hypothetical protein
MKRKLPAAILVIGILSITGGLLGFLLNAIQIATPFASFFFDSAESTDGQPAFSLGSTWVDVAQWCLSLVDTPLCLGMIVLGVLLVLGKSVRKTVRVLATLVILTNLTSVVFTGFEWFQQNGEVFDADDPAGNAIAGLSASFGLAAQAFVTMLYVAYGVAVLIVMRGKSVRAENIGTIGKSLS